MYVHEIRKINSVLFLAISSVCIQINVSARTATTINTSRMIIARARAQHVRLLWIFCRFDWRLADSFYLAWTTAWLNLISRVLPIASSVFHVRCCWCFFFSFFIFPISFTINFFQSFHAFRFFKHHGDKVSRHKLAVIEYIWKSGAYFG